MSEGGCEVKKMQTVDVLAFGAHPDDVELGCGGTVYKLVQRGYSVGIVDLTRGEMGTRGTVTERQQEAERAAEILGAAFRLNLEIPDAGITLSKENLHKVMTVIRRFQPSLVLAPYPEDRHPDHEHTSRLVKEACFYAGLKKLNVNDLPAHRPRRVMFYMMTTEFEPGFVVDISEQFEQKLTAILAHRSQFYNPEYDAEETFISSKDYREAIEFRARHFGWKVGVQFAEPFWMPEWIALDDPFLVLFPVHKQAGK